MPTIQDPLPACTVQPCRSCPGQAELMGMVDFSKTSANARGLFFPTTGISVFYYRCTPCGMLLTPYFDPFSREDFLTHVYNHEYYEKIDLGYAKERPAACVPLGSKVA
ncbi:hypothetical protein [Magnetococcus sp. PR-3]|uniref:hypothetical protein n=1 Tax=Magnetococcus sp. PR-3 TaxID=3120355 RepID=UPI002FCE2C46